MSAQLPLLDAPRLVYERDVSGVLHLRYGGELLPCAVVEDSAQQWLALLFWRTDDGVDYTALGPHADRDAAGQAAFAAFCGLLEATG